MIGKIYFSYEKRKNGIICATSAIRMKRTGSQLVFVEPAPKRRKPNLKRQGAFRGTIVPGKKNEELKVFDVAATTVQVNTTGAFTLLAIPVLGSDFNNRIGRKVVLKSVYVRGFVCTEAANGVTTTDNGVQMARMILFEDKQPNGAVPVTADLLVGATPVSHLNMNNRDRFRVLADKQFVFDPYHVSNTATQSFASSCNQIKGVKKFKKINIETIFNATNGGSIADINSGALYMFWIGSIAAGTNTDANAVVTTRVRYVDA